MKRITGSMLPTTRPVTISFNRCSSPVSNSKRSLQPCADVVAQGKSQVFPSLGALSFAPSFEGKDRDTQPVARRQGLVSIGFGARWRAWPHIVPIVRHCAVTLELKQSSCFPFETIALARQPAVKRRSDAVEPFEQ